VNLRFADRGENIAADRYDYDREWKRDDFTVNGQLNAGLIMDVLNGDPSPTTPARRTPKPCGTSTCGDRSTDRYDQCGTCLQGASPVGRLLPRSPASHRARPGREPATMTADEFDHVGFRAVHGDLTSSRGFRWPFPDTWAEAPGPILDHDGAVPAKRSGTACASHSTGSGAASGGIPAITCLVVGWNDSATSWAATCTRFGCARCHVLDVLDVPLLGPLRLPRWRQPP
jgi:hypothetical protein